MIDVIVETRGGVIAEIYCDCRDVHAIVIDWDELEDPERAGKIGVDWSPCVPLSVLPRDTREQYVHAISSTGKHH